MRTITGDTEGDMARNNRLQRSKQATRVTTRQRYPSRMRRQSSRGVLTGSSRRWSPSPLVNLIHDLRTFHPAGARLRPLSSSWSMPDRLATPTIGRPVETFSPVLSFAKPNQLAVCVRRRVRKQVMHAFKIAGGKVGKPRHSFNSQFSCKG